MKNSNITNTHKFKEAGYINDIVAIDDTHYLVAAERGLLRISASNTIITGRMSDPSVM
jgi:hypothetical protein